MKFTIRKLTTDELRILGAGDELTTALIDALKDLKVGEGISFRPEEGFADVNKARNVGSANVPRATKALRWGMVEDNGGKRIKSVRTEPRQDEDGAWSLWIKRINE